MPNNIVKSFAAKTGKSVQDVEQDWQKAKAIAKDAGHAEDFPYITGILKKMLKTNENKITDFKSYLNHLKTLNEK